MQAWTQQMSRVSALTVLFLVHLTAAAPLTDQTTEIEYYPVADSTGCYYNFQHYDEGDRIITNEPCLNCTCHNRMLMCYLRVCPFTKAIGQDCKVEKRPDQCCPVITCPEVPVQLLTSTTTESSKSTDVGHPDTYGCSIDNLFYSDGARVPSDPNKPCELCYCIRNRTACVMQECTLKIEGCKPVYQEGVCCPVKYDCEHPEETLLETTVRPTPAIITTTLAPGPVDCVYNNEIYADGALVKKDIPCEHCYCMRGDIVCAVQECGPTPLDKVNCTALPRREGQCCPDTYDCENAIEDISTEGYDYSTTPVVHPAVSEEEASSAVPSAAVTSPPRLEEAATVVEGVLSTEKPAEITPGRELEEEQTSSELPAYTESEEPIAFATTQIPIRATQPKKEDEGYDYPKPAIPGLELTPSPATTPAEEVNEIVTVVPAEVSKHTVPSGEQLTEKPPSAEEEKIEETTSPSPSVEDREKEGPAEAQTTEPASAETGYTPKEAEVPSYTTNVPVEEHTTLVSITEAAEEEATAGSALPTIQPSELPEEGAATAPQELPVHSTIQPITKLPETSEVYTAGQTEAIVEEGTTAPSVDHGTLLPEEKTILPEVETEVPETAAVTTQQPSRESITTAPSSEQPAELTTVPSSAQPAELTTAAAEEEVTEKEKGTTERVPEVQPQTTPQIPLVTRQPSTAEQSTEEVSKEVGTEYSTAAATASGEHVTVEPEDYVPSHDQVPVEGEEEEVEEVHTEEPASFTEESKRPEATEAPAAVTEREEEETVTPESEQEGTPPSTVTQPSKEHEPVSAEEEEPEHVTKGEASTIQEHLTELSTPEYVQPEKQSVKPEQDAEETRAPSELTPAPATESATSPSATEQPSIVTTIVTEEHITEGEAAENLIPGEGSCLVDGQTYSNNSSIPPINQCQVSCKCVSSIVQCESVACSPPPTNADNCTPVFEAPTTCCPTYSCTPSSSTEIESDSHKMQETSTSYEELTTAAISLEKYTTEQPKESTKHIAETSGETTHYIEFTEKEVTAPVTEEAAQPEATTPSQVSEEIQTTPAAEATEQPISRVTAAVEENEIPTEEAKEPETPQQAATTTTPEKLTTPELAATTSAAEAETEAKMPTTSSEGLTPSIEEKVQSPASETGITPTEEAAPAESTEKSETTTESAAPTMPASGKVTEAPSQAQSKEPEGTTATEAESVTPGREAVTTLPEEIPSKETEAEVTSAAEVPTTEGIVEPITEVIPAKEMGKPESHVTESSRKPTSEIVAEAVTTEAAVSSSQVPQEERIPVVVAQVPQEQEAASTRAPTAALTPQETTSTPELIAHDLGGPEEEEGESATSEAETVVTTEAAKEAITTEGAEEISPTELSRETASVEVATEIEKEATTETPIEGVKQTEPPKEVTLPEASPTQQSGEVTSLGAAATEPVKEAYPTEAPKEATSPEVVTTEAVKEALTTEPPKEVTSPEIVSTEGVEEPSPTEASKEVTSPEVAETEGVKEPPSTEVPQEVTSSEIATEGVKEAAPTESPEEITSPEIEATEGVKEASSTEPSAEVTSPEIEATEGVKEASPTEPSAEVTSPEVAATEGAKEASPTEPSLEITSPETAATEGVKEAASTELPVEVTSPEIAATEGVEEAAATEDVEKAASTGPPSSEITATEGIKEASSTELPSAETALPTELPKGVTSEVPASTEAAEEIRTESEQQASSEITTPVPSSAEVITGQPETEAEEHATIAQVPESEIAQDHVTPEEVETVAPETEAPEEEAATTEGPKAEVKPELSEVTVSAPYETTVASEEEPATTVPTIEKEAETPSAEEIPEVTERVAEATTQIPERTRLPGSATLGSEVTEPTTTVPLVVEQQTIVETEGPQEVATEAVVAEEETVKPHEAEVLQPEVTTAEYQGETTRVRTPEEATTALPISEQPQLPEEEVTVRATASPTGETETERPTTEATEGEAQTEAQKIETTAPELEAETRKPLESVTIPAEVVTTEEEITTVAEETVTFEKATTRPEEVTAAREQEPSRTEEAETEASKSEVTTPLPEKETIPSVATTPASEVEQPSSETVETRVPEISEEAEDVTTAAPALEAITAASEEPEKLPQTTVGEGAAITTVSPASEEVTSKTEEASTVKEELSKTTELPAEKEATKSEATTPSVTSRPEIPGEGLPAQEPSVEKEQVPEVESAGATTLAYESSSLPAEDKINVSIADRVPEASTPIPSIETSRPSFFTSPASTDAPTTSPSSNEVPEIPDYTASTEEDYPEEEDQGTFGPGTCRYGGKLYMSAQQIPRDDPCDFCFCFRSDIICLQQSCPPPIPHCHEEPIRGFCCPRYECPVSMATTLNLTTTSTTTTTTLPPHFLAHAYSGRATKQGCQIQGQAYQVGEMIKSASGPCLHCTCGGDGQMKCDPKACSPEPMLRQMIAAAASRRRR